MSFSLPSYSKFNKRYINPLIEDQNMIPSHVYYYSYLKTDIEELRSFYMVPRSSNYGKAQTKYTNLSTIEKEDLRRDFNIESDAENYNPSVLRKYIYPFPLEHLVDRFYSSNLPSETSFVVDEMISSGRLKINDSYVYLNLFPFTKEEYQKISNDWDSSHTFAGVAQAVSSISTITSQYKKDYKYLISKLESLQTENEYLKNQNNLLSQQLLKATTHTWI